MASFFKGTIKSFTLNVSALSENASFTDFKFFSDLNGSPMTLTYSGSGGSEAMLTFKKKSIYGRIKLHHDRTFIIESVSSQVVWAEIGKFVNAYYSILVSQSIIIYRKTKWQSAGNQRICS